jgi:hypothetical protein
MKLIGLMTTRSDRKIDIEKDKLKKLPSPGGRG